MSLATQSIPESESIRVFFRLTARQLGFLHWEHLWCRGVLASDGCSWTSTSSRRWTSTSWTSCSKTSWSWKGKSIISDIMVIRKTKLRPFRKSSHWCQHGCECKYQQVPAEVQHDRVQTELRGWFDDHWPQIAILWSMRDAFDDADTDGGDPAILKHNLLNGAF